MRQTVNEPDYLVLILILLHHVGHKHDVLAQVYWKFVLLGVFQWYLAGAEWQLDHSNKIIKQTSAGSHFSPPC